MKRSSPMMVQFRGRKEAFFFSLARIQELSKELNDDLSAEAVEVSSVDKTGISPLQSKLEIWDSINLSARSPANGYRNISCAVKGEIWIH